MPCSLQVQKLVHAHGSGHRVWDLWSESYQTLGKYCPCAFCVVALPCGEDLCVHTRDLSDAFNVFRHSSPAHILPVLLLGLVRSVTVVLKSPLVKFY